MQHFAMLVTGPPGSGKTTLLLELLRHEPDALIYDTTGDFVGFEGVSATFAELPDFAGSLERARETGGRHLYSPRDITDRGEFGVFCSLFLRYAYEQGGAAFVCDEIAHYTNPHSLGEGLSAILTRSRHYGIRSITASQRPVGIPGALFAGLTHFATFRHFKASDTDWILTNLPQIEEEYMKLDQFEYVMWEKYGGVRVLRTEKRKSLSTTD